MQHVTAQIIKAARVRCSCSQRSCASAGLETESDDEDYNPAADAADGDADKDAGPAAGGDPDQDMEAPDAQNGETHFRVAGQIEIGAETVLHVQGPVFGQGQGQRSRLWSLSDLCLEP